MPVSGALGSAKKVLTSVAARSDVGRRSWMCGELRDMCRKERGSQSHFDTSVVQSLTLVDKPLWGNFEENDCCRSTYSLRPYSEFCEIVKL